VAGLQARESRNWGSILRGAKSLSLLQGIQTGCASKHSYPLHTMGSLSCGTAASEYSAEIKNEWRNNSTPTCFYGTHSYKSFFQKIMGCTCRMQEKRHKLFHAHNMKGTKAII